MYRENNNGPRTDPCGTPSERSTKSDFVPLQRTLKDLSLTMYFFGFRERIGVIEMGDIDWVGLFF